MTATDEIVLERQGGLGLITLNRPKALNTLSLAMYRVFDPQLVTWGGDPRIHALAVRGAGDRAFCAGGDVRAIYEARRQPAGAGDYKADFFREEYCLIQRVHRFPKPYVALCDGITMGGGCGISINGSHRVVTERSLFAMPEVHIGLFPDVGASRFLTRCPGQLGRYLALTGTRIRAADALYCGIATHYVPHARIGELTAALAGLDWRAGEARSLVDAAIARLADDPGPATLPALQGDIDRCFAGSSVEEIVAALGREEAAWAKEALAQIERASPLSLKITFPSARARIRHGDRGGAGAGIPHDAACHAGARFLRGHPRAAGRQGQRAALAACLAGRGERGRGGGIFRKPGRARAALYLRRKKGGAA